MPVRSSVAQFRTDNLDKMKLAIVVKWYPPDLRVPARRWGNLVACLQQQGVECTVISAGGGEFSESVGSHGERIIRIPISNFDGAPGEAAPKSALRRLRTAVRKGVFAAVPPVLRELDRREWLEQVRACPLLLDIAKSADGIISSYGPFGPFVLGHRLARRAGKPWIVDIRDSMDFKDGLVLAPARSASRALERRYFRDARLRITIGETLARYLNRLYGTPFHAIYNGWTDADLVERRMVGDGESAYLYYAGSIYSHRLQALEIVLQALKARPELRLKIRLLKDHTQGALRDLINECGVQEQVDLLPPVEQHIVDQELGRARAALVLEDLSGESELMNGIVTGKLLGLLASGIPGFAVSAENGEIRELVREVPGWYGVSTVEQFKGALDDLMRNGARPDAVDRLRDYHMSQQCKKLLQLIQDVGVANSQSNTNSAGR